MDIPESKSHTEVELVNGKLVVKSGDTPTDDLPNLLLKMQLQSDDYEHSLLNLVESKLALTEAEIEWALKRTRSKLPRMVVAVLERLLRVAAIRPIEALVQRFLTPWPSPERLAVLPFPSKDIDAFARTHHWLPGLTDSWMALMDCGEEFSRVQSFNHMQQFDVFWLKHDLNPSDVHGTITIGGTSFPLRNFIGIMLPSYTARIHTTDVTHFAPEQWIGVFTRDKITSAIQGIKIPLSTKLLLSYGALMLRPVRR